MPPFLTVVTCFLLFLRVTLGGYLLPRKRGAKTHVSAK